MSYYPDLSIHFGQSKALKVGWLDERHRFKTAKPPKWLVQKLWQFCQCSVLHAKGYHECNLAGCHGPVKKVRVLGFVTGRNLGAPQPRGRRSGPYNSEEEFREYVKGKDVSEDFVEEFISLFFRPSNRKYDRIILGAPPNAFDSRLKLGDAEIIVFGKRGKFYIAPNMIYHYVTVHHYKPPEEFIQALKDGPYPPGPEYIERLKASFPIRHIEFDQTMWRVNEKKRAGAKKRKSV
jgi:hypothetical protein